MTYDATLEVLIISYLVSGRLLAAKYTFKTRKISLTRRLTRWKVTLKRSPEIRYSVVLNLSQRNLFGTGLSHLLLPLCLYTLFSSF